MYKQNIYGNNEDKKCLNFTKMKNENYNVSEPLRDEQNIYSYASLLSILRVNDNKITLIIDHRCSTV